MAKTDYKNIDQYHEVFSGEALIRLQAIRELVHKVAPRAEEVISYQIPAFKLGGKHFLIYYGAFAKHLIVSSPWSEAFLATFEVDLQGMKVSKSVIQLPMDKPLPLTLIKKILLFRKKECEAKLKMKN